MSISHYMKFLLRNRSISTFSDESLQCLSVTMFPTLLNSLSDGTVVHGAARYFQASGPNIGQRDIFSSQQCNGHLR